MATLVLGMGNPLLSDDGVGLRVAERLAQEPLPPDVVVTQSEVGGLRFLDLVRGFTKVYIVDALQSGRRAGEITKFTGSDFVGGHRYASAHSISLGMALDLGRRMGYEMPEEVTVYAIEARDVETFSEELSEPVAQAAERVLGLIREELAKG